MQVKKDMVTKLMKSAKQFNAAIFISKSESDSDPIVLTYLQIYAMENDHYSNIF